MMKLNPVFVTLVTCLITFSSVAANNNHRHGHATPKSASVLPAWKLADANNRLVSSDHFKGRPYVLVLHLGKGCLHCAEQLHALGDAKDAFGNAGLEVVAVSTDDAKQLGTQLNSLGRSFAIKNLLSDSELNLFRDAGAIDEDDAPLHATILVDAAGRVRWSNVGGQPFMDVEHLIREATLVSVGATTSQEDDSPQRPKVFLNKSRKIVDYQLNRLDNERLLMVTRKTDDSIYAPVWSAILAREGMDFQYRREALNALVKLNGTNAAIELIAALDGLRPNNSSERQNSRELAKMLMKLDATKLASEAELLVNATNSPNEILAKACYAALTTSGLKGKVLETSRIDQTRTVRWLRSIGMIRDRDIRESLRDEVYTRIVTGKDNKVRNEAILAMKHFKSKQNETWTTLASMVMKPNLRDAAIKTLLALPKSTRDADKSVLIIEHLLESAEALPVAKRTEEKALLAMELVDSLIVDLEEEKAAGYRDRMNQVSVRIVRIKTIKEEMRYDIPYFAAQAGRPIQIVLENEDLMPHNLIVCKPGKLKQVANDGLKAGPRNGKDGKQYVPNTRDVLFATDMVQANESERLTFNVPKRRGEYPFVCTFPQHWSRMYGVMVVVDNVAAWEKNPVEPKDPIGNKRQLVKKWAVGDFADHFKQDLTSRSVDSGKKIFTEATCAQCHRLGDFGGAGANVGPALDDMYLRWKGSRSESIKQILEPSSHIDPQYKMFIIATDDGLTRTGLIVSQDDEKIEMLESGSVSRTTTILKDEIDEMAESKKSIMPKALLDNFSKEEILDLVNYLEMNQKQP